LRIRLRIWLVLLCFTACLGWQSGNAAFAQSEAAAAPTASASAAPAEKSDGGDETGQFRHAPVVKAVARMLHIDTESAAQISEDINSGILILAILFLLFKVVPKAIRSRTATIQKKLIEARTATEEANERLSAVEAKLARIGEDIEAIRKQTEQDTLGDERRIKQAIEDERERIVKSAEQEIESAGAAAQRELKRFAAELSIDQATRKLQLTVDSDRELVKRFGKELIGQFGKGGQN
jgi:F-type H+-transporting ATPase subunit b